MMIPITLDSSLKPKRKKKPRTGKPFVYRFAFYHDDDIRRAEEKGPEALTDLRIRDTYLKLKSGQMGIPLRVVSKKEHLHPRAATRIGDWDAVVDQDDFAQRTTAEILEEIKGYRDEVRTKKTEARSKVLAKARAIRESMIWHRPEHLMKRFVLVGDQVHEVRYRDPMDEEGNQLERVFETSPHAVRSNTVQHKGKTYTVAWMRRMLSGGALPYRKGGRVKGSGKPRYKAQIRIGSTVKHLGMFDSPEDRDHAVRVARVNLLLGLSVYPSP
jgi:hypothetical protein